jgi:L-2-hydroxycarboxylate dehydrogenase (NAD+)
MISEEVRVHADVLKDFCQCVFEKLHVPENDARTAADVIVAADLRGIDSHGAARLRRYVTGLREGEMLARPEIETIHDTSNTALIDGGGGFGPPVAAQGMRLAIAKAAQMGVGFVTVRNSNHYGIAGYYSMMALEHDFIGISMTNAGVVVVPTFGTDLLLGTNPLSVAVPAGGERPFVLDMATSTVTRGKIEVHERMEKALPIGWVVDERGEPATDAARVLERFVTRAGGGLLPLGGVGEMFGGHKGYGLALLVDILCGALSGAGYADTVYPKTPDGKRLPGNVGHFFGALRIDAFRPLQEFKATMDDLIRRMKGSRKAEGQSRIYVHGEKEFETVEIRQKQGIPLHPKVAAELEAIAAELEVTYPMTLKKVR